MKDEFKKVDSTSNRLKMAMELREIKASQLAEMTGIDKGSISHYRSGKYAPKQNSVYKLGKALDVSEMWLWGYDVPMERPMEQKENDDLVDLIDRLQKDKKFRHLVIKLSNLNLEQLDGLMKLMNIPLD